MAVAKTMALQVAALGQAKGRGYERWKFFGESTGDASGGEKVWSGVIKPINTILQKWFVFVKAFLETEDSTLTTILDTGVTQWGGSNDICSDAVDTGISLGKLTSTVTITGYSNGPNADVQYQRKRLLGRPIEGAAVTVRGVTANVDTKIDALTIVLYAFDNESDAIAFADQIVLS